MFINVYTSGFSVYIKNLNLKILQRTKLEIRSILRSKFHIYKGGHVKYMHAEKIGDIISNPFNYTEPKLFSYILVINFSHQQRYLVRTFRYLEISEW